MGHSQKTANRKARRRAAGPASRPDAHRASAVRRGTLWTSVRIPLAAFALCLLVAVSYSNSLGNGFVWDDHVQIVMNPAIQPGAPLAPLFTTDARRADRDPAHQTTFYRPLQVFAYRAVTEFFGDNASAFHGCGVAFAMAGALAAFWVFWLLTHRLMVAFAAASLFAVHPIHTEAVDWAAALPDLGCGLFILLAFAFFLKARSSEPSTAAQRRLFRCLALFAFGVALLWKETAAVFPVMAAAYCLLGGGSMRDRLRTALRETALFWLLLVPYLIVRTQVLGSIAKSPRTWNLTPGQFLLTAPDLALKYVAKLAFPFPLNAYYTFYPVRSLTDPRAIAAVLFALFAIAALVYFWRRSALPVFCALWVCLTLLPALDINALGRNAFAERYLYLPSVGFCLLISLAAAWLGARLPSRLRLPTAFVLLIIILGACIAEDIARNPDWKDDATLFTATLPRSSDAPFVHVMVAAAQSDEPSESAAAEQNYDQAVWLAERQVPPDRLDEVVAYQGLASLYSNTSRFDQALDALAHARSLAPDNPDLEGEEGIILARAGRGREALPLLEQAHREQPRNENVLLALGLIARDELHDPGRAVTFFSQALAIHTQDDEFSASLHNNLGAAYADQNNFFAAIEQFRRAVGIAPLDVEYRVNLASALAASGNYQEATAEAYQARNIAPTDPAVRELLQNLASVPGSSAGAPAQR